MTFSQVRVRTVPRVAPLYTECRKKAGKIAQLRLICPAKGGEIAADPPMTRPEEEEMGGIGKKTESPNKDDDKSSKKPPAPADDDDYEDGDIATPKRDRSGDDDEPL
jgi:hypothetical protein